MAWMCLKVSDKSESKSMMSLSLKYMLYISQSIRQVRIQIYDVIKSQIYVITKTFIELWWVCHKIVGILSMTQTLKKNLYLMDLTLELVLVLNCRAWPSKATCPCLNHDNMKWISKCFECIQLVLVCCIYA